jgi:L-asparaginase II
MPRFDALFELTRGRIVESIHFGAIAVVDTNANLLYSYGDPQTVAFLRSSAKPFQAIPFVERGGVETFGLTLRELALACASHEGSDEHVRLAESIQQKTGIQESDLQCGVHMPGDTAAYQSLIARGETPTPNRNNCSGKHSAMLACAKMQGLPLDTYLQNDHPIQRDILAGFAEMCGIPADSVALGVDGCSAPNFAVPLVNAALGFARLADPRGLASTRTEACRKIASAMTTHPEMISGRGEFDCRLMQVGQGNILCKRGAEGFQVIGLLPGALGPDSPGVGIAIKVSDGDLSSRGMDLVSRARTRPAVTLEILRQLGALDTVHLTELAVFGPILPIRNHRGIVTGESRPVFELVRST